MTVERSKRRCLLGRFYKYIKEMRSVFFNSANHMVFCLWRCRCQRGHQKFAYLIRTKTQYLLRTLHEPHFFIWTSF